MEVKGITIHNTGSELSARELYEILKDGKVLYLCHFLVDENEVIQCTSEDKRASHTGKGYDFGNLYTISIEICRSKCDEELYLKAQKKAIEFVKSLMEKYNLTKENIYFHSDFDINAYCPHRILNMYRNKKSFLEKEF